MGQPRNNLRRQTSQVLLEVSSAGASALHTAMRRATAGLRPSAKPPTRRGPVFPPGTPELSKPSLPLCPSTGPKALHSEFAQSAASNSCRPKSAPSRFRALQKNKQHNLLQRCQASWQTPRTQLEVGRLKSLDASYSVGCPARRMSSPTGKSACMCNAIERDYCRVNQETS